MAEGSPYSRLSSPLPAGSSRHLQCWQDRKCWSRREQESGSARDHRWECRFGHDRRWGRARSSLLLFVHHAGARCCGQAEECAAHQVWRRTQERATVQRDHLHAVEGRQGAQAGIRLAPIIEYAVNARGQANSERFAWIQTWYVEREGSSRRSMLISQGDGSCSYLAGCQIYACKACVLTLINIFHEDGTGTDRSEAGTTGCCCCIARTR